MIGVASEALAMHGEGRALQRRSHYMGRRSRRCVSMGGKRAYGEVLAWRAWERKQIAAEALALCEDKELGCVREKAGNNIEEACTARGKESRRASAAWERERLAAGRKGRSSRSPYLHCVG